MSQLLTSSLSTILFEFMHCYSNETDLYKSPSTELKQMKQTKQVSCNLFEIMVTFLPACASSKGLSSVSPAVSRIVP